MTSITPAMDKYEDLVKLCNRLRAHYGCDIGECSEHEAADAIEALQTEREQDRRDAERYRWLRNDVKEVKGGGGLWHLTATPEQLDAVIDNARGAE